VYELVSTHPYLCKRVGALQEMHQPGTAPAVSRNPLAYPLAPALAFGAVAPGPGLGGLLAMVAIIGIIAAIAIPALLRARVSANESAAIADVREVIRQEAAFADSGRPYADPPSLLTEARSGYRRSFELGPEGATFVYVAEPIIQNQSGVRTFCGDNRGIVCYTHEEGTSAVADGQCDLRVCSVLD
jgi:type II secretory pathway pseudopilin PulG